MCLCKKDIPCYYSAPALLYTNASYACVSFGLNWISEFDNINNSALNFVCFDPNIVSGSRLV